jgi:uncharacterized membrane protein YeaQ/YmgE (transglycosylase-associated protein family)
MNLVMWVLVAVLAGLVAGFVLKRGSYGRGWDIALGLIGSVVVSWLFQSQWVSPDPGMVAGDPRRGRRRSGPDRRPAHDLSRARLGPVRSTHPGAARQSPTS